MPIPVCGNKIHSVFMAHMMWWVWRTLIEMILDHSPQPRNSRFYTFEQNCGLLGSAYLIFLETADGWPGLAAHSPKL